MYTTRIIRARTTLLVLSSIIHKFKRTYYARTRLVARMNTTRVVRVSMHNNIS